MTVRERSLVDMAEAIAPRSSRKTPRASMGGPLSSPRVVVESRLAAARITQKWLEFEARANRAVPAQPRMEEMSACSTFWFCDCNGISSLRARRSATRARKMTAVGMTVKRRATRSRASRAREPGSAAWSSPKSTREAGRSRRRCRAQTQKTQRASLRFNLLCVRATFRRGRCRAPISRRSGR
jgi:hypothetical protein